MKRISGYLIVLLVLILGFSEQESLGAEWGWGVYTYTSVYFVNPDNVLDYVSVYAGPDSLVMGELSRHDYVSYSVGTAEALAQLSAGGITPVLKAWAELGPYNANEPGPAPCYASASAVVRELYQYVGTAPREFTLTLNLSGEMSGSDSSILGRITAGSGLDDFEFLGDLGYTEINLQTQAPSPAAFPSWSIPMTTSRCGPPSRHPWVLIAGQIHTTPSP
jgi:hypothetical protein